MVNRKLRGALKISLIYFIAGCLWIISSDTILKIFVHDGDQYAVYQTYKGWAFILSSAVLLFVLLYSELKKRDIIESVLIKSLREKKVLLNEVHHRVKNNLNTIISLLYIEAGRARAAESLGIIETLSGRIFSMALVHDFLYKSPDFKEIFLKDYIPELAENIRKKSPAAEGIEIKYNIDNTALGITQAIPVGLMLNEIVDNSIRHAFTGIKSGLIIVDVREQGGRCFLDLSDNGNGGSDTSPNGPGVELVQMLVKQLSGEISIDRSAGFKYQISFPMAENNG